MGWYRSDIRLGGSFLSINRTSADGTTSTNCSNMHINFVRRLHNYKVNKLDKEQKMFVQLQRAVIRPQTPTSFKRRKSKRTYNTTKLHSCCCVYAICHQLWVLWTLIITFDLAWGPLEDSFSSPNGSTRSQKTRKRSVHCRTITTDPSNV